MNLKPAFGWKSILATGVAISFVILAAKTPFEKVESVLIHMINAAPQSKQIASEQ